MKISTFYQYLLVLLSTASLQLSAQHLKNVNASLSTDSLLKPNETQVLRFMLRLNNNDSEYGDSLAIEFPAGVTPISSSTNPLMITRENQPAEAFNGVFGQVVSWGDNNNLDTIGGIETGVLIPIDIEVMVDDTVSSSKRLRFFVSGDQMKFSSRPNPKDAEGFIDLKVKTLVPNLALNSLFKPLFYRYPKYQMDTVRLAVNVRNIGGELNDFGYIAFSAANAGYSLEEGLPLPFLEDADTVIKASVLLKTKIGIEYDFLFAAITEPDKDFSNNFDSARFFVSDTVLSRDKGLPQGTITLPEAGEIGTWLEITRPDTLTSVSVNLAGLTIGDSIRFKVYNYSFGPLEELAASPSYYVDSVHADGWYTVTLDSGLVLNPSAFFIAIAQDNPGYLGLSYNDYKYSFGDNYYRLASDPTWLQAENSTDITLVNTLLLRANFGDKVEKTVGINSFEKETNITLHPNPAQRVLYLNAKNVDYKILTLSGQTIQTGKTTNGEINIVELPNGFYLIKIGHKHLRFIKGD